MSLLVPTMICALLDHPALERGDLSGLETVMYGAFPISAAGPAEAIERIRPVHIQRGRYASAVCDMLTPGVDRISEDQQRPLYWLTSSFTDTGGEFWYGVTPGSDLCPRDRAAELAVRPGALARDVIASAYIAR